MSWPRVDYAALPEAPTVVSMYLANEKLTVIMGKVRFSDEKIRNIVAACGVPLRRVGRPRLKPLDAPMPEVVEPIAPRDPCPHCGIRRDIGCKHQPSLQPEGV